MLSPLHSRISNFVHINIQTSDIPCSKHILGGIVLRLKLIFYRQVARLLTGIELSAVTVQNKMLSYFPSEVKSFRVKGRIMCLLTLCFSL